MNSLVEKIRLLEVELNNLQFKQTSFNREIDKLRSEIDLLKKELTSEKQVDIPFSAIEKVEIIEKEKPDNKKETEKIIIPTNISVDKKENIQHFWDNRNTVSSAKKENTIQRDLEKFIGENLISKIGIAILLLGVGVGVKYSIDHALISPLMRLILGYILGIGLLGFGLKLKENYKQFSAVLVSGSMAVNYLITFFGYSFYGIIPQSFAFVLLLSLMVFTVLTAIKYNQSVIAHIGFLGAYFIPYLLSTGSNNYTAFFTYITIINCGILAVSYFKNWKSLNLVAFLLTWITFVGWILTSSTHAYTLTGITFGTIFFLQFYGIFLVSKIANKLTFEPKDTIPVLSNTAFYFLSGYNLLNSEEYADYLGLFSIMVGFLHFIAAAVIKRYSSSEKLFYLSLGLVFAFITLAIPIQLDGNPVVLLWISEAIILFYLARKKSIEFYEFFAYPLLIFGLGTYLNETLHAYSLYYKDISAFHSFVNIHFLTSILVSIGICFITYYNYKTSKKFNNPTLGEINQFTRFLLPFISIALFYITFFSEINAFFDVKIIESYTKSIENHSFIHKINVDYVYLKKVWNLNYSIVFILLLTLFELRIFKNEYLKSFVTAISIVFVFLFLTVGLYNLGELTFSYINDKYTPDVDNGVSNVYVRYFSYALIALLLNTIRKNLKLNALKWTLVDNNKLFDILLATSLVWLLSSELVIWMDITHFSQSFKLILSILWGIYAVVLIIIGIAKGKQHIRIGALTLFTFTLIKLFFYDIAHLDTIAKTIVFLTLGVLLLITSFLYNKFKHLINPNE